jgi:uncharacterized protein (DUF2147 family)
MKPSLLLALLIVGLSPLFAQNDILGKWKTIDDNTNEARSVVELVERGGKFYGKVVIIFPKPGEDPDPVCDKCDENDLRFRKKIIGMEIIRHLQKDGPEYSGGDILDPENGKVYRSRIWVEGNELKVRGYWGPFFRTQTWLRAN